jgi:hypothetical protein
MNDLYLLEISGLKRAHQINLMQSNLAFFPQQTIPLIILLIWIRVTLKDSVEIHINTNAWCLLSRHSSSQLNRNNFYPAFLLALPEEDLVPVNLWLRALSHDLLREN